MAAAIGFAGTTVAEDTVMLINGDRLTGQIEAVTDESIRLCSPHLGELVIPRKSVASFGAMEKTPTQMLAATNAVAATTTNVVATTAAPPKLWKNTVEFGFNLSEAQHSTQNLTAHFETTRQKKPTLLHLETSVFWGDTDGVTTTQKAEGRAKYEYDWSKRWYWYDQLTSNYDRFRGIDLELHEGAGAGYRLLDSPLQQLAVEMGPLYLLRVQTDQQEPQSFAWRTAQNYGQKINAVVSWKENLEFIQRTDDFAAHDFRGDLSLIVALTRLLSVRLSLTDEYTTRPVRDTPENSLQFITSLGVTF